MEEEEEERGLEENQETPAIKESDLRAYFFCPYNYFLKNHYSHQVSISASGVQALLFEQMRRSLFNLTDHKKGRIVPFQIWAGKHCHTAEEMGLEELKEHLAIRPGKLGDWLTARWISLAKRGHLGSREIVYDFRDQIPMCWEESPKEIAIRKRNSRKCNPLLVGGNRYQKFVYRYGAPVLGYTSLEKGFEFEGQKFRVKFPEIRKGNYGNKLPESGRVMYIDDPTLWKFNAKGPEEEKSGGLETSSLVTLRILAYCTLAHSYQLHRLRWGLPDEVAEEWGGTKKHLDDRVVYRHLNATLKVKNMEDAVTETRRDDSSLDALRRALERFGEGTKNKNYEPKLSNCRNCAYNAIGPDGRRYCDEAAKKGLKIKAAAPVDYFKK